MLQSCMEHTPIPSKHKSGVATEKSLFAVRFVIAYWMKHWGQDQLGSNILILKCKSQQ